MILFSSNLNGSSPNKLTELLELCQHEYSTYPDVILTQEVKSLHSCEIPGYLCLSDLEHASGGVSVHVRDHYNASLIYGSNDALLVSVKCANDSAPVVIVNFYNAFSSRANWRGKLEPVLEVLFKTRKSAVIFGSDFNFGPSDPELREFIFASLEGNESSITQKPAPTCRHSTQPDIIFGTGVNCDVAVLGYLRGSDHCCLAINFEPPATLEETPSDQFFFKKELDDSVVDELWRRVDVESISQDSPNSNSFFLVLELSLRRHLVDMGLIGKCPHRDFSTSKFVAEDAAHLINKSRNSAGKLRKISELVNPSGSSFSFLDIASALSKAEKLPVDPSLTSVDCSRSSKSPSPLGFSFAETWDIICCLDKRKSCGPSVLSASILQRIPAKSLLVVIKWFKFITVYGYPDFLRYHKVFGVAKSDGGCRPICVIGILGKIYDILLLRRLEPLLEPRLPRNQTAYLRGRRGCEEHLLTLKVLADLHDDLIIVLNDFSKCFNSIPNSVIRDALVSCGVSSTLLDAVMDSLVSFRICDSSGSESLDFFRGVKQGGCSSGLIFCCVVISLSHELDSLPLERPIFLGGFLITHLSFADDCGLLALCVRDARLLSFCVSNWSSRHGMLLNSSKCYILGSPEKNLWYQCVDSAKYLGVRVSYKDGTFGISRMSSNLYYAYKLRPICALVKDTETLKNLIKSFHSGLYAFPVCLSDQIGSARHFSDVMDFTRKYDKHWSVIIRAHFGLGHKEIISIPRVCSELGLTSARFGVGLITYTRDFLRYLSNADSNSIAYAAFASGAVTIAALHNSLQICEAIEAWPVIPSRGHWLLLPRGERRLVARVLLTIRASNSLDYKSAILSHAANREFKQLRDLIRKIIG